MTMNLNEHLRPGVDARINGVPFKLVRWEFNEDGYAGHIYFKIPDGIYEPDSNNGAYHFKDPNPDDISTPNAHMATPCMPHGESFFDLSFRNIILEAARYIDLNMTRVEKVGSFQRDYRSTLWRAQSKWKSILAGKANVTFSPEEAACLEVRTETVPDLHWDVYEARRVNSNRLGSSVLYSGWRSEGVLCQLETDGFPDDLEGATVEGWPGAQFAVTTKKGLEYRFTRMVLGPQKEDDEICPYRK